MIEIDRATFADCPYTPEQIVALEADAGQYAWVALDGERVVGYVSAFVTQSLDAGRWEVDELAVHPEAQGRGIGTALVERALEFGAQQAGLREARALVAVDNLASQRVFAKNGFQVVDTVDLLSYRVAGRVPRLLRPGVPVVRPVLASEGDALAEMLGGQGADADRCAGLLRRGDARYLVAVEAADPGCAADRGSDGLLGAAELIHVRTLQYEGLWIEALAVSKGGEAGRRAGLALFGAAIEEVKRHEELDLVGYLASPRDRVIYAAAVSEGMTLVESYRSFVYAY
jgi:ribosomal protein S18 acetylase RimI-like enzyme